MNLGNGFLITECKEREVSHGSYASGGGALGVMFPGCFFSLLTDPFQTVSHEAVRT